MLTSSEIKFYTSLKQKKFRENSGRFLIEGFHLVEECLNSPFPMDVIILRDDIDINSHRNIAGKIKEKKIRLEVLHSKSFKKITETESSQGIAAIVPFLSPKKNTSYGNPVIALDRITDPGNLGTIIRTAYWFKAGSILISENSVDIYNSKVIRSAQGAIFHTNIENNVNLESRLNELKSEGYKIYLLTPKGELSLKDIKTMDKTVFVFGNESEGISDTLLNSGFGKVKIPGYSDCESLNVAVSAGIVLYNYCGEV